MFRVCNLTDLDKVILREFCTGPVTIVCEILTNEGKQLFKNIDLTLSPGTRVGIVGKNGTGKSTLLKILSGMVAQNEGTVKSAENLQIVYFDQHRENIPSEVTV